MQEVMQYNLAVPYWKWVYIHVPIAPALDTQCYMHMHSS